MNAQHPMHNPRVLLGAAVLLCAALVVGCQDTPLPVAPDVEQDAEIAAKKPGGGGGGGGGNSTTADAGFTGFLTTTAGDFMDKKIFKDDARRFEIGEGQPAEVTASLVVGFGEVGGDACWFEGPDDQEVRDNLVAVLDGSKSFTASLWMRYDPRKKDEASDSHNLALNGASTDDGFAFAGGTTFHGSLYPRGAYAPTATWIDEGDGDDSIRTYGYKGYFRVWAGTDTGERVWLFCNTGGDHVEVTVTIE